MTGTLPMGDRAVLVTDVADPAGWADAFRARSVPGVAEVVPGAETVLVACDSPDALAGAVASIADVTYEAAPPGETREIVIPVRYDGEDLEAVAAVTGLSVGEVIARHSGAVYVAAFCGFSPGFAYLRGVPTELELPRRATPRTRVPQGAVAIAAGYAAVYPRTSPGGWHLLGRTDVQLFDATRPQPALIRPGTRVRFEPVRR